MHKTFVVLVLVLLGLSCIGVSSVGLVGAETEVETTAYISVPSTFEAGQAVGIQMWIEPAPPTTSDRFHNMVLSITNPEGLKDEYNPMTMENGTLYWSYMISKLGNYTFQFSYKGEIFESNRVTYKPSESPTVTLTSIGDPIPPVETEGGSWSSEHSLSQARAGLGVAIVNGKIYAIGGSTKNESYSPYQTSDFVGTNEEYDPATDQWTTKTSMPTPRANFAIAVVQNKIYCINSVLTGFKLDEIYNIFPIPTWSGVNEVYDPTTDTWKTKKPMPTAVPITKANVVNDKIYILSGRENWMYDPANDSWTQKSPSPTQYEIYTSNYPSAVIGDKIYFLSNYAPMQIYDTANDSWSFGSRCPRLDPHGAACATTGKFAPERIYFFTVAQYHWVPYGDTGTSGSERRTTFIYNPQTDSWSAGARIPAYRTDFGVAVLNDTVYAVGGYIWQDSSGKVTICSSNEQYTPASYGEIKPQETTNPNGGTAQQTSAPSGIANTALPVAIFGSVVVAVACLGLLWYSKRRSSAKL
jgi:N-acetylneuraminic acid mutarotase